MTEIVKTLVQYDDAPGVLEVMDTITFQGELWLVTEWLSDLAKGFEAPRRIICLSRLPHIPAHQVDGVQFVLLGSLSRIAVSGPARLANAAGFEVIDMPAIRVEIAKNLQ